MSFKIPPVTNADSITVKTPGTVSSEENFPRNRLTLLVLLYFVVTQSNALQSRFCEGLGTYFPLVVGLFSRERFLSQNFLPHFVSVYYAEYIFDIGIECADTLVVSFRLTLMSESQSFHQIKPLCPSVIRSPRRKMRQPNRESGSRQDFVTLSVFVPGSGWAEWRSRNLANETNFFPSSSRPRTFSLLPSEMLGRSRLPFSKTFLTLVTLFCPCQKIRLILSLALSN